MTRSEYNLLPAHDKELVNGAIDIGLIIVINDTTKAKKNPFHLTRATYNKYLQTNPTQAQQLLTKGYIVIDEGKTRPRVTRRTKEKQVMPQVREGDVVIAGRIIPRSLIQRYQRISSDKPMFVDEGLIAYLLNLFSPENVQAAFDSGQFVWKDGRDRFV